MNSTDGEALSSDSSKPCPALDSRPVDTLCTALQKEISGGVQRARLGRRVQMIAHWNPNANALPSTREKDPVGVY